MVVAVPWRWCFAGLCSVGASRGSLSLPRPTLPSPLPPTQPSPRPAAIATTAAAQHHHHHDSTHLVGVGAAVRQQHRRHRVREEHAVDGEAGARADDDGRLLDRGGKRERVEDDLQVDCGGGLVCCWIGLWWLLWSVVGGALLLCACCPASSESLSRRARPGAARRPPLSPRPRHDNHLQHTAPTPHHQSAATRTTTHHTTRTTRTCLLVRSVRTISSSGITCAGEKKWAPTTRPSSRARLVPAPTKSMSIVDVLVASTQSGRVAASRSAKMRCLRATSWLLWWLWWVVGDGDGNDCSSGCVGSLGGRGLFFVAAVAAAWPPHHFSSPRRRSPCSPSNPTPPSTHSPI